MDELAERRQMEEEGGMPGKLRSEYAGAICHPSPLRYAGDESAVGGGLWRDKPDEPDKGVYQTRALAEVVCGDRRHEPGDQPRGSGIQEKATAPGVDDDACPRAIRRLQPRGPDAQRILHWGECWTAWPSRTATTPTYAGPIWRRWRPGHQPKSGAARTAPKRPRYPR